MLQPIIPPPQITTFFLDPFLCFDNFFDSDAFILLRSLNEVLQANKDTVMAIIGIAIFAKNGSSLRSRHFFPI